MVFVGEWECQRPAQMLRMQKSCRKSCILCRKNASQSCAGCHTDTVCCRDTQDNSRRLHVAFLFTIWKIICSRTARTIIAINWVFFSIFQMPGVTVKDVDQAALVKAVAEFLKKYVFHSIHNLNHHQHHIHHEWFAAVVNVRAYVTHQFLTRIFFFSTPLHQLQIWQT